MIQFDGHSATVCSLAFSPDSMTLASGAKDGSVKLWDSAGGVAWEGSPYSNQPRKAITWDQSGEYLAVPSGPHLLPVRRDGKVLRSHLVASATAEITSLVYVTPELLGVGSRCPNVAAGSLHLFDMASRKTRQLSPVIAGSHGVRAITAHLATRTIHWLSGLLQTGTDIWRSWDINKPNATDVKLGKPASAITVSPDGGTVAIASDWLVRVFTADGKPRTDLTGHKGKVAGVGFIHGGRTVVSASWDETVRFWDVTTGKETARFPLKVGKLTALAVSPDGTRVAVGGTDGPIVLIDAE